MSVDGSDTNPMVRWYRSRIAEPSTDDEVYGYWVFISGILLGILGILLYLTNVEDPGSTPATAGIALSAIALLLLMVGPVIRLPLRRTATTVSYLGALAGLAAVTWFTLEYPGWRADDTNVLIISLYALGLVLIAGGAALVPMLSRVSGSEPDAVDAEPTETVDAAVADDAEEYESEARFELFEDRGGKWRWRLRHRNGNIIADGGQGYSSRQKAQQGLESVKRNSPGAAVVREETDEEAGDAAVAADAPYPPGESQGTFETYEDAAGDYRWRLVHDNGEILADGGEGYSSRGEVVDAVERVQGYVGDAEYLRIDPTAFQVYRDAADEWRWRLIHRNGEILADSGEGYGSRSGASDAVDRVRDLAGDEDTFEVYEDDAGEHRWRLVAGNDEIVADGGEGFASRRGVRDAVERVREYAPDAHALDYSEPVFELFVDAAEESRWRLLTPNGNVVADSGEGYASRSGARDGIHSVKRNAPNAEVADLDAAEGDEGDEGEGGEEGDEGDEGEGGDEGDEGEGGDEGDEGEGGEEGDEDDE